MKRPNIKRSGILYSAYSDRGRAVKAEKRRHKRETTKVPVSVLLATAILPLATVAYA